MKTRLISILTILVLVIGLIPIPNVFAAGSFSITITANKANAVSGDEITYTITANATEGVTVLDFVLDIPEGLTFVVGSGTVAKDIMAGSSVIAEQDFTEGPMLYTFAHSEAFELKNKVLGTFKCTVDNNKSGDFTVGVKDLEVADSDYEELSSSNITTSYPTVKVIISATGVTLDKTELNLKSGENSTLVATLAPEGTTDSVSKWESSNKSVATVDNGKVTALAEGTATIKVTTTNGKTATCTVTVTCAHTNKTEVPAKDATCTETGNNKYYKCNDCGKIYKADGTTETTIAAETIAALKHDFSVEQSDETHHWKKCSRCDATTEKIQHSGDTWKYDETNHWKVCGCGVVIEKTAHTAGEVKREKEVQATCKAEGSHDEVTYCTVCNKELSRTHKVDLKTDHTPGEAVQEKIVPATHTAKGSYDEVVYCSVCGAEISRTNKEIDMIPHDGTNVPWESDNTNHWKTCGCGVIIEQAVHIAGEKVNESIVKPTCTEDGKHDEVVYCTICKHEMSRTNVTDKAPGHKSGESVKENIVDSTCTKEGSYDEVVYCTECKEELSRTTKTTEKKEHTPAEPVKENEIKATVDKEGNYEEVVYCKDCHKELSRENKTTPKFVYEVLEGKDGEHKEDTTNTLTFKVNGELSKFIDLKVDGKIVDKKYYSTQEGSTIVTLSADYLNTLSVGSHEISFVYDDGEVATTFKVAEATTPATNEPTNTQTESDTPLDTADTTSNDATNTSTTANTANETKIKTTNSTSVNTGDNSNMALWIVGLAVSGILFVIVLKCTRKSQKRKH